MTTYKKMAIDSRETIFNVYESGNPKPVASNCTSYNADRIVSALSGSNTPPPPPKAPQKVLNDQISPLLERCIRATDWLCQEVRKEQAHGKGFSRTLLGYLNAAEDIVRQAKKQKFN